MATFQKLIEEINILSFKKNPINTNALFNRISTGPLKLPTNNTIIPYHPTQAIQNFYDDKSLILAYTSEQRVIDIRKTVNIKCEKLFQEKRRGNIESYKLDELRSFAQQLDLRLSAAKKNELIAALKEYCN